MIGSDDDVDRLALNPNRITQPFDEIGVGGARLNIVWVIVRKGSKCMGHGDGYATTYELATIGPWGDTPYPAFTSPEAAAKYVKGLDIVLKSSLIVTPLEVIGDE